MADEWFSPASLTFQSIRVRGKSEWTFFELRDSAGQVGIAEITFTQVNEAVIGATARLANRLRGERLESDEDVLRLTRLTPADLESDRVLATAVSGLRCAVADALARTAGLPLADYIRAIHDHRGEPSRNVQLYANINRSMLPDDRGPVDRSPDAFAEQARRAVDAGFTTVKCAPFDECKAPFSASGLPFEAEAGLERVRSAKQAIGEDRTLYVDCHSRFDLGSALALEPELREAGAGWYEEPVDPLESSDDLRRIREAASLPIAGAEHGYGVDVFRRLIDTDVLDIVMPDVKFCGGPVEAYRTGRELEPAHPGSVSMHSPSGPVSLLASAHATAAFGNVLPLEHAVYEVEWRAEVLEPLERVEGGHLKLPQGPGLGAWLDRVTADKRGRRWEP